MGVGGPDPPSLRAAALRGRRRRRSPDGRVLPARAAIEARKNALVAEFAAARGRQPTEIEVLDLRRRATLETRPAKTHRSLAELTGRWRQRAEPYVGTRPESWVAGLAGRNDLPLLRAGDLADEILADAAAVAVADRGRTPRHLLPGQRPGRGPPPAARGAFRHAGGADRGGRTRDRDGPRASLLLSAPELHHTPARSAGRTARADSGPRATRSTPRHASSTPRAGCSTPARKTGGPAVCVGTVARRLRADLPGRDHALALDQALAVEQIATSGRALDVLVGPAGTGKSTTMAGLRAVWEAEHGPGSVLGLAPSAAAAEVLADELGIDTENTAKWLSEHRREPERLAELGRPSPRARRSSRALRTRRRSPLRRRIAAARGRGGPLAAPARPTGHRRRGQLGRDLRARRTGHRGRRRRGQGAPGRGLGAAVRGGGGRDVRRPWSRDRDGLAPELGDVRRFQDEWERRASVATPRRY